MIKKIMRLAFAFIRAGMKVAAAIALATFLTVAAYAQSSGAVAPDPTATITSLTNIWYSVGAVAITILLWNVGRRLVVRWFK